MNPTPEETEILDRCAQMLKRSLKGLKRVIFDLASEDEPDTVRYEIHGKIKGKR